MKTGLGPPHRRIPKLESTQVCVTWQVKSSRGMGTQAAGHPGWARRCLPFKLMGWKLDPESNLMV